MEDWQNAIIMMEMHLVDIKRALRAEIRFKNTLIYILLGVAFGASALGFAGGLP